MRYGEHRSITEKTMNGRVRHDLGGGVRSSPKVSMASEPNTISDTNRARRLTHVIGSCDTRGPSTGNHEAQSRNGRPRELS